MQQDLPTSGRLAGVDYGTVRVGVAITDPGQIISSPFENYTRQSPSADAHWFQEFAKEESVVGFVVGLPLHISGDESEKSKEARAFGAWLSKTTGLPVSFHDERYSSAEAEQQLLAANLTSKRRKARMDMLAAQLILRTYLERRR